MSAETMIELDRPRPLRYTVRSLRLLEDRSRRNLGELLVTNASIGSATWLIWAGLIHDDAAFVGRREPTLTIDDVSDLLQKHWFERGRSLPALQPVYTDGLMNSGVFEPRETGPKKEKPEPANRSTLRSGSTTGSTRFARLRSVLSSFCRGNWTPSRRASSSISPTGTTGAS